MCVFLGSLCFIFLLRDEFKSLKCWLDLWLSCMLDCIHICVFPSWKTVFKLSWHLLDTWLSVKLLNFVLIAILTDPRQLGGLIEKFPGPSIASRQLVDWSSFYSCVFALFLNTFSIVVSIDIVFLDTFLDRCLDTSICRELLRIYI